MGMPGADERILTLSYPWIGYARAAIRNENVHPQSKYLPHFCVTMLFKLSLRDDSTLQILIPFLNHLLLGHLVWAHVTKIVLYYVMYEACQAGETYLAIFVFWLHIVAFIPQNIISWSSFFLSYSLECSTLRKEYP